MTRANLTMIIADVVCKLVLLDPVEIMHIFKQISSLFGRICLNAILALYFMKRTLVGNTYLK